MELCWLVVGVLVGCCLGLELARYLHVPLRQRSAAIVSFCGKQRGELIRLLGQRPHMHEKLPEGRCVLTWYDNEYALSLMFDARGKCLGVYGEHADKC